MKQFSPRTDFRRSRQRQRTFEFIDRACFRERWFKLAILAATLLAIAFVLGFVPRGRYVAASVPSLATQGVRAALGIPTPRKEIDERWRTVPTSGRCRFATGLAGDLRPDQPRHAAIDAICGPRPRARAAPLGQLRPHALAPFDDLRGR